MGVTDLVRAEKQLAVWETDFVFQRRD